MTRHASRSASGVCRYESLPGIDLGSNLGNAVWHSGTLAAAKQAALLGLRGIAFSTPVSTVEPDFDRLSPHVEQALSVLLHDTSLRLVNVNIPPDPKGVCWTRQTRASLAGPLRNADAP